MCEQERPLYRRLSLRRRCSDGSVSVALVVEVASLVLPDDTPLPLCPAATEGLLLCLRVDTGVHTPGYLAVPATT